MAAAAFKVHDGYQAINLKITRNKIAIQVLENEHAIHKLEQAKGAIYQQSLLTRIALIEKMNKLEAEQLDEFTLERLNEINRISIDISTNYPTKSDLTTLGRLSEDIQTRREEIEYLHRQFAVIDSKVQEQGEINVITGKFKVQSLEDELA